MRAGERRRSTSSISRFVAWSLVLLVLGLRLVYRFSWGRSAATLGIVALVVAAMIALPSSL